VTTPTERAADVNRLIEDVLLLVQHRARFQQVTIDRQYSHNLPNVTDAGIQHAVANVVKNAFDAMPKGGVLTIKTIQHQRWVRIDITDTGPGIPEEIRSRIFEPFFSTKPIHQGNGLGLIIAREAVERSGGSIECSSQVGVGTTFRIQLPISEGEHVGHGA
jgi:signal transduction histidine kinase